jgi:hypothetical protein
MCDFHVKKQGLIDDRWDEIEQEMSKSVAKGRALFQVTDMHFRFVSLQNDAHISATPMPSSTLTTSVSSAPN